MKEHSLNTIAFLGLASVGVFLQTTTGLSDGVRVEDGGETLEGAGGVEGVAHFCCTAKKPKPNFESLAYSSYNFRDTVPRDVVDRLDHLFNPQESVQNYNLLDESHPHSHVKYFGSYRLSSENSTNSSRSFENLTKFTGRPKSFEKSSKSTGRSRKASTRSSRSESVCSRLSQRSTRSASSARQKSTARHQRHPSVGDGKNQKCGGVEFGTSPRRTTNFPKICRNSFFDNDDTDIGILAQAIQRSTPGLGPHEFPLFCDYC